MEEITTLEFMDTLKRRRLTIRRFLRQRNRGEDYPNLDDKLVRELRLIREITKLHNMNIGG